MPRRQYSATAILTAVTSYNLGRTLEDTRAEVMKRARVNVPRSTLHAWIGQFASVCTFTRSRKKFSPAADDAIRSKTFDHTQEYKFAFHRLKTIFLASDGARCSDADLPHLSLSLVRKKPTRRRAPSSGCSWRSGN